MAGLRDLCFCAFVLGVGPRAGFSVDDERGSHDKVKWGEVTMCTISWEAARVLAG